MSVVFVEIIVCGMCVFCVTLMLDVCEHGC